jgi:LysR family transcriptional regulator, transcriptional activator of nhaA
MAALNYKHLHYFWVVAKTGSIAVASKRLHITPQTISGQLSLFEDLIGEPLFTRLNRRFELTEKGKMVLSYADEIFSIGQELEEALRERPIERPIQFKIGICDSVPKTIAYKLIEPALRAGDNLRIICKEGNVSHLLGELAIHKLDIVIADSAMPNNLNVRAFNHLLGECGISFFATKSIADNLTQLPFPMNLHKAPMLIPGAEDPVSITLMKWFESYKVFPKIIGEFDDGALMKAFGYAGIGIFTAPTSIAKEVEAQYNVVKIGETKDVTKSFYAISVERKISHPAVIAISETAKQELFL